MKEIILKPLILILFVNIWLQGCDKSDNELNPSVEVQDFVWKGLNAYYLYQEDIDDLSDRRFSSNQQLEAYLGGFDTPGAIFNSLKKSTDSRSELVENYEINDLPTPLRTSFTTGMEFGLFKDSNILDTIIGVVSHILPNSQASTTNLSRGDFFYGIINDQTDTIILREDNYNDLLLDYPQDTLKLLMAYYDGDSLAKNDIRVDLVKKNYQYSPILLKKVFNLGAKDVGYLLYNNDFSDNYIADINATILEFKNQSVNELIIDLRYAVGSYSDARTISEIASMITGQFTDEIFINRCKEQKTEITFVSDIEGDMIYSDIDYLNKNIHTSIQTCKALNISSLNDEIIKRGIENININTGLFGRWSLIGINPMIIFDSAHNESGFESIANQISKISFNKIHILLGFVKGKRINDLVRYLPKNSNIYFTSLKIERSMTHDEIKSSLTESVTFDNNPQRIFEKIKTEASKDDLILITGSNYLAKEIYNEN